MVVAAVEPEENWILSATVGDDTGELVVERALPGDLVDSADSVGGPGALANAEVDDDGVLHVSARVTAVASSLPADTVAGMIDAVLDAAHLTAC